ncbi:MAG: FAD-dependent oxidoreductase [SAR324 cluster bacterium]|nr:FAD-dependent oxidoreductase [SAR324 cluster bacterium]
MKVKTEALVIGGGAIGVCCAYYLWKKGVRVTLLEKDEIAAGSSYGNAGLVVPSHFIPLASPEALRKGLKWMFAPQSPFYIKPRFDLDLISWIWKFCQFANKRHVNDVAPLLYELGEVSRFLYEELVQLEGMQFGFDKKGLLLLYKEEGAQSIHAEAQIANELGVPIELLDIRQIKELEPNLKMEVTGGLYYPQDAHLNPADFVCNLASFLAEQGVIFHKNTEVVGFENSDGTISQVHTTKGHFIADQVILASGSWSPGIVKSIPLKIPIQPAKGYSVTIKPAKKIMSTPLLLREAKVAITPLGERLRFAGTLELAGMDSSINQQRVQAILHAVPGYLPEFASENLAHAKIWAGLRPCTPDGLPYLGRAENISNLIVAAGHAMVGISLAPVTGLLVAQIFLNKKPAIDLHPLRVGRFS